MHIAKVQYAGMGDLAIMVEDVRFGDVSAPINFNPLSHGTERLSVCLDTRTEF